VVYAVALLASGQSTTISCTFAGQVIMQVIITTTEYRSKCYQVHNTANHCLFLSIVQ
jgi:Mn2+/Fe2+ NRAMP family transporter